VCQPRCTSRKPRPARRPPGRDGPHVTDVENFSNFVLHDGQPPNSELFDFPSTALPQDPLHFAGYGDFMDLSYPIASSHGDMPSGSASNTPFSSVPWLNESAVRGESPGSQLSPSMQNVSAHHQNFEETRTGGAETSADVLGHMVDLLAQPGAWHGFPGGASDATQVLSHDARDRIVAAVQLLLHRALCQTRSTRSPLSSSHGLFGRIVALPPSHVLVHFLDLYAARVDFIQPYLGMAGSPKISINDILQVNMADVGILLVVLLITQGAMLTGHHNALILADGLTEVCRVALNDVLESRSMEQSLVGGSTLQLLTLCTWSGKDSFFTVRKA
jgi:hypothetical protein